MTRFMVTCCELPLCPLPCCLLLTLHPFNKWQMNVSSVSSLTCLPARRHIDLWLKQPHLHLIVLQVVVLKEVHPEVKRWMDTKVRITFITPNGHATNIKSWRWANNTSKLPSWAASSQWHRWHVIDLQVSCRGDLLEPCIRTSWILASRWRRIGTSVWSAQCPHFATCANTQCNPAVSSLSHMSKSHYPTGSNLSYPSRCNHSIANLSHLSWSRIDPWFTISAMSSTYPFGVSIAPRKSCKFFQCHAPSGQWSFHSWWQRTYDCATQLHPSRSSRSRLSYGCLRH